MTKNKTSNVLQETQDVVVKLLQLLDVGASVEVDRGDDDEILVQLETDESGLLIGHHGQGLVALQQITNLILYRQVGEWPQAVINVGDYWERRKETLEQMVKGAVERLESTGEPQELPPMNAAERRVVHLLLQGDGNLTTESEGSGRDRRVVIKPVQNQ